MGNLRFGEIYTKDLDLIIQAPPAYPFPARDLVTEHIPGRSGDLIIDNKCWKNVERTYNIASVFRPGSNFISNAEKFINFLTSKPGYHRLEDSYDPSVYRMAMFKNNGVLSNLYDEATVLEVTFECKPQRFLKDGEKPILYQGASAILTNPTGRKALPKIHIKNITHDADGNTILLVTVKNINGEQNDEVVSTVTLTNLPSGDIVLDSEMQDAYSIQNGDSNKYVSLNNKGFPYLDSGDTEVSISKYTEHSTTINKYDSLLNNTKKSCLALYRPSQAIVESKQKSIYLKSYNLLKQQVSEVYEAKPYATYCLEKAEDYSFISFNTVLDDMCQTYTFQTDYSSKPDWLDISGGEGSDITIRVGNLASFEGYNSSLAYFISNSDKKIRKLNVGDTIGVYKESTTVTIKVYPAIETGKPNVGNLAADYSSYGIPDWLDFEVQYDEEGSPKKIIFKHSGKGYYYLPKNGLFGKPGWKYFNDPGELNSLTWSSYKKAFMPSGVSASTTASFKYYYLSEVPQYEPTYRDVLDKDGNPKKDANGNVITEISNKVHFRVESSNDLKDVRYIAESPGYFRCNDADQGKAWKYYAKGATIESSTGFINKSDVTNIIYYLANKPDYSSSKDFPKWLDPKPIIYDVNGLEIPESTTDINAAFYDFKVLEDSWYRYSFSEKEANKFTDWVFKNKNDILGIISPVVDKRSSEESFTVYLLEGKSGEFPIKEYSYTDPNGVTIKDIGFFYVNDEGQEVEYANNIPPSWIKILVEKGKESDLSDTTIKYITNSVGSYKWDKNSVWVNKQTGVEILTSTYKDDSRIYYLSDMPSYDIYDLFIIDVNKNGETGNPESITIKAKEPGYFRAKNESYWKYIKKNDIICTSKITESTIIFNLKPTGEALTDLSIEITPRWWSL